MSEPRQEVSEIVSAAARELGRRGGHARNKSLTKKRRIEIASAAGKASGAARRRKTGT